MTQALMARSYAVERERGLYRRIVTRLAVTGIRREDMQVAATENHREDWYAGRLHGECERAGVPNLPLIKRL